MELEMETSSVEDEVFVGEVGAIEKKRHLKLNKRKTQMFSPMFRENDLSFQLELSVLENPDKVLVEEEGICLQKPSRNRDDMKSYLNDSNTIGLHVEETSSLENSAMGSGLNLDSHEGENLNDHSILEKSFRLRLESTIISDADLSLGEDSFSSSNPTKILFSENDEAVSLLSIRNNSSVFFKRAASSLEKIYVNESVNTSFPVTTEIPLKNLGLKNSEVSSAKESTPPTQANETVTTLASTFIDLTKHENDKSVSFPEQESTKVTSIPEIKISGEKNSHIPACTINDLTNSLEEETLAKNSSIYESSPEADFFDISCYSGMQPNKLNYEENEEEAFKLKEISNCLLSTVNYTMSKNDLEDVGQKKTKQIKSPGAHCFKNLKGSGIPVKVSANKLSRQPANEIHKKPFFKTPTLPGKNKKAFNVVSPVAKYIKEQPVQPLIKNVRSTKLGHSDLKQKKLAGCENIAPLISPSVSSLPAAEYQISGKKLDKQSWDCLTDLNTKENTNVKKQLFLNVFKETVIRHRGPSKAVKWSEHLASENLLVSSPLSNLPGSAQKPILVKPSSDLLDQSTVQLLKLQITHTLSKP